MTLNNSEQELIKTPFSKIPPAVYPKVFAILDQLFEERLKTNKEARAAEVRAPYWEDGKAPPIVTDTKTRIWQYPNKRVEYGWMKNHCGGNE